MINNVNNILVIDDDSATVFLTKWVVEKLGFQGDFLAAANGEEALNILNFSANPAESYLILLDINMPIMDGWAFLMRYQQMEGKITDDNIVIVMLSDEIEDKIKLASLNYDFVVAYLPKPIRKRNLLLVLESHFKNK